MTVFQPDSTLTNIKTELGAIVTAQVGGITRVYTTEPDGLPEDGSVVVGSPQFKVDEVYSGKLDIPLMFPVTAYFMRRGDGEDIIKAESYFLPMILAFSAWVNMNLDQNTILIEVTSGGVVQLLYAGQAARGLRVNVAVRTEFNIPLS
jgi:hypothetical protein